MATFTEVVKERFDVFCNLCCLHGLPYLRSSNALPATERVLWVTIFAINLVLSSSIVYNVWVEWVNTPFMITYDSELSSIWEIPFPSVAVCSLVNIKRSVVDLTTTNDTKKLLFSSFVCTNKDFFKDKRFSVGQEEMETFYDFLAEDSYPQGSRFWLPKVGYPEPDRRGDPVYHTFPRWSALTGQDSGLSVELQGNMSEGQEQCTGRYQGFKVIVNSPAEAPIRTFSALKVPMLRDFLVHIDPFTIHTSVDYESNDVRLRSCVFQGERTLNNFGTYTTNNCILQCIIDLSLEMCDCVSFYLPRNSSIRICSDDNDHKCLEIVSEILVYGTIHKDNKDYTGGSKGCSCYPSCNEITYNFDTSHTLFFPETDNDNALNLSEHKIFAKISVYFNSLKFLGVHRQADSTLYDFLATCGGLLGLLTGFSCISAVEIIYHLLIRPMGYLLLCYNKQQTRPPVRTKKNFLVDHYYYN